MIGANDLFSMETDHPISDCAAGNNPQVPAIEVARRLMMLLPESRSFLIFLNDTNKSCLEQAHMLSIIEPDRIPNRRGASIGREKSRDWKGDEGCTKRLEGGKWRQRRSGPGRD
jgi:hypothetical protein